MKMHRASGILMLLATVGFNVPAQEQIPADQVYRVFADLKSYEACNVDKYAANFLSSLEYEDCDEIVECGLAQIAMLKLAQPKCKANKIMEKVDELAVEGATPAIRFKAYLTSMVFANPEMFVAEKFGNYRNGDELFQALAERLQSEALASN